MRGWVLLAAVLAIPLSSADPAPWNTVPNGGFEHDLDGWSTGWGGSCASLVKPGGAGSASALRMSGGDFCFLYAAVGNGFDDRMLLRFLARQDPSPGLTGQNVLRIQALADPNLYGSPGQLELRLSEAGIELRLFEGPSASAPAPADGAWHEYTVLLQRQAGRAVLLLDGAIAAVATGPPPFSLTDCWHLYLVHNVDGESGLDTAPDIEWDDLYWGPG